MSRDHDNRHTTEQQISILENNFQFFQAWSPNAFEEFEYSFSDLGRVQLSNLNCDVEGSKANSVAQSAIVVSRFQFSTEESECIEGKLSEFFSAFGTVVTVTAISGAEEDEYMVVFEEGSGGVQKVLDSLPIKMFGDVLSIRLADGLDKQTNGTEAKASTASPFPLVIASPKNGAWYKASSLDSFSRPSTAAAKLPRTMGKLAAAASRLITDNFNPPSTEVSTPKYAQRKHEDSHQRLPSSSLHSLLSPTVHDPLFDDDSGIIGTSCRTPSHIESTLPSPDLQNVTHFHCDETLPSWVWAPNGADTASKNWRVSKVESQLNNTLQLGRARNTSCPLLSLVPRPSDATGQKCSFENTNLHLLHKQTNVTVRNNSSGQEEIGSYTLYQARHPSLAPLISATICSNGAEQSVALNSVVSVFDITPSSHRPLHEVLRTGDFFTKPLHPGMEGHETNLYHNKAPSSKSLQTPSINSPMAWFQNGSADQDLCRCRTIFDRGRDESKLTQQDKNIRAELRQFRSSTSTMFSMLAEQDVFDDLRKLHLLPQSSSHHPQVYSRFNQRIMMHRVGCSYHADVADLRIRFLALQLFHAVTFLHSKGLTLGDQLRPDRVFLDDEGWARLVVPIVPRSYEYGERPVTQNEMRIDTHLEPAKPQISNNSFNDRRTIFDRYQGKNNTSNDDLVTIIPYPGYSLVPLAQWQKGQISNLTYLMMINSAAGRYVQ